MELPTLTLNTAEAKERIGILLKDLGGVLQQRAEVQASQQRAVAKVNAKYADELATFTALAADAETELADLVAQHPGLVDGNKIPGLTTGAVRVINLPEAVEITGSPDALLLALRNAGALDCIKLGKDSVDKTQLKKRRPTVEGYTITQGRALGVTPNLTGDEIRIPLTSPADEV